MLGAVDEDLIKESVDLVISTGLAKAGYKYFVIDGAFAMHHMQN